MTNIKFNLHFLKKISHAPVLHTPVFWVIISLSLVISPHLKHFPGWSILLITLLFLWRIFAIKKPNWPIPKWLILIIGLASFGGVFLSFGTVAGLTAGSTILSILLALKLHESFSQRDFMLLVSLSFFIIVTNFLFSQSIPTVVYMLFSIIILIVSMLYINQGSAPLNFKYKIKFATKLLLQAIPIMVILFIFFPRISGPLWQLPNEKTSTQTGLSDSMSPGKISELTQSNAIAFRVKFDDIIPDQNKLYWRALVLWNFDGNTWEQDNRNPSPPSRLYVKNHSFTHYTITMQAHHKNWLYALDLPSNVPDSIIYTNNYTLESTHKISSLFQYKISSVLQYQFKSSISSWEKSAGLKIPLNTNPETIQLGKNLALQYDTDEKIINHILQLFNRENFHYTLKPPLTPGFHSVDQFLFNTKRGFCEHYASSFTLIMRAAGIPARVILGFQGGTINPLNGVVAVKNSDAHAWSEVWIKNKGWVRIDPTAAVAPERVEKNLNAALDQNEVLPFHMQINTGFIKDVLFYWDAIDNQWNQWVVGYNDELQQRFLKNLFNKNLNLSDKIIFMLISIGIVVLIVALFIMRPDRKQKLDPALALYQKFCHTLALKGIRRNPHEGPLDYATRAKQELPELKDSITLITRLYIKIRYEASHSDKQLRQFKLLIGRLKTKKVNLNNN